MSASVGELFIRSVPGASIGYQKHLLSLRLVTSQTKQGPWSFTGGFWGTGVNGLNPGRSVGDHLSTNNHANIYKQRNFIKRMAFLTVL